MPVRIRVTLLFALIVFLILSLVGGSVYYFSYENRIWNINKRLKNRAITTARLLSQSEIFDNALIQKIDSSTNLAVTNKNVIAFDYQNKKLYEYNDISSDSLIVPENVINEARIKGTVYLTIGDKDVVAYHFVAKNFRTVMVLGAKDVDGRAKLMQLRTILILSLIGGLLITVAGGYVFSERLLRPIRKIADDVNEISAQNLARRITISNNKDEWNYLSTTLNKLLNRLQDSFEVQQQFIANASHELSTPLTSISSQLEVSLQRNRESEEYRRVMLSIYQDVRQLNKLTQALLEFASASGNAAGITIDLVRIDEILLRLPGEMLKSSDKYSVSLIFKYLPPDENELLVWGNEELLFSAISNIVSNACKYSSNHKAVVSLEISKKDLKVYVQDNGPGIDESEIKNIFQPFYRINSHSEKGFGLGLSLSNRIIKLHSGEITVQSASATGTTFIVSLPVANFQ